MGHSGMDLRYKLLLAFTLGVFAQGTMAQCPTTIATFPYTEGFEFQPAWTSGGSGNDWAWGAPSK